MSETATTVEFGETRDGLTQLQRRWQPQNPRAAVLLVHGIGEHSGRYIHVGEFLASRGYDVLAFDNRGFGQSGGRRAYVGEFSEFIDDIEDGLADRRQLGLPVVLFGHSLGGLMSTTYLTADRPQPDLAVLSSPALAAEVPQWQRVAAPVLSKVVPKLFVKSKAQPGILSRDEEVERLYHSDPLIVYGATAGLAQEIFTTMEATSQKVDRISVPTYVLHGDADELVPQSASRPLEKLDLVTYRSWSGLRHECLNEPEKNEVMDEIETWLSAKLASAS